MFAIDAFSRIPKTRYVIYTYQFSCCIINTQLFKITAFCLFSHHFPACGQSHSFPKSHIFGICRSRLRSLNQIMRFYARNILLYNCIYVIEYVFIGNSIIFRTTLLISICFYGRNGISSGIKPCHFRILPQFCSLISLFNQNTLFGIFPIKSLKTIPFIVKRIACISARSVRYNIRSNRKPCAIVLIMNVSCPNHCFKMTLSRRKMLGKGISFRYLFMSYIKRLKSPSFLIQTLNNGVIHFCLNSRRIGVFCFVLPLPKQSSL